MPIIYLSPSTQEWNPYITGAGSEEYHMNLVADAMIPYLKANAIAYKRNTPDMTAASSIRDSNAGYYDFHLALHSNAAPEANAGQARGIIGFYYPTSTRGKRGAELLCDQLRKIYPLPDKVEARSTTALGEVRQPQAPSVLMEIGFHDNVADATWVQGHIQDIARQLVAGLCDYFNLPFISPWGERQGRVDIGAGTLNLRNYPANTGTIIANMPKNEPVTVYGALNGWYSVGYGAYLGYASAAHIDV